ncbi:MAG: hypothetical protein AB2826_17805 [Candidatus Thiodiazotropha sp.]
MADFFQSGGIATLTDRPMKVSKQAFADTGNDQASVHRISL